MNIELQLQMIITKLGEFESFLRENGLVARDRIGGIELACEVTGYKANTIYQKVCSRAIPFNKPEGRLVFSENKLRHWMMEGDDTGNRQEVPLVIKKRGRKRKLSGNLLENFPTP